MIHNITLCNNDMCPKKDTCYRFLAWKEAVELSLTNITCRTIDAEGCEMYKEEKHPLYECGNDKCCSECRFFFEEYLEECNAGKCTKYGRVCRPDNGCDSFID